MSTKKVIVYSTPLCPYCVYAKNFLKEKGVTFEDVDVSKDQLRAMEMVQKSGQRGVPVIEVDEQVVIGFQPDVLKELLALQ